MWLEDGTCCMLPMAFVALLYVIYATAHPGPRTSEEGDEPWLS